jgi:hypothetical protein
MAGRGFHDFSPKWGTVAGTKCKPEKSYRMPLFAIVNAASKDKPYELADGGGLHLLIARASRTLFQFHYFILTEWLRLSIGRVATIL